MVTNLDMATFASFQGVKISYQYAYSSNFIEDINGDGYPEVLVGGPYDSSSDGNVFLVYGSNNLVDLSLNSNDPPSAGVVKITGESVTARLGGYVSSVGDINNDGIKDFLVGASDYSYSKGRAYLIYGSHNLTNINLGTLTSVQGVKITGINNIDTLGFYLSKVGDVNADGYNDFLVSAQNRGVAYLIYGGNNLQDINLGSLSLSQGIKITGNSAGGVYALSPAGDMNNDGKMDFWIGAPYLYSSTSPGSVFLIYGGNNLQDINLGSLSLSQGIKITGESTDNFVGTSIFGGKDVNGDGIPDVFLGAYGATNSAGGGYLLFGSYNMTNIDLSPSISSTQGIKITGDSGDVGSAVALGDVNGDGKLDFVLGAKSYSSSKGRISVIYGSNNFENIYLTNITNAQGYTITGRANGDQIGNFLDIVDLDGDGKDDILTSAVSYAVYLIRGSASGYITASPTVAPTAAPTVMPTVAPTAAPTAAPTDVPTVAPTTAPTVMPTVAPTTAPSTAPTDMPTVAPTTAPSAAPTDMPTVAPTTAPSTAPTDMPTVAPTTAPSAAPTDMPTLAPTTAPSAAPTDMPTVAPTTAPSAAPTDMPTVAPTTAPSAAPTDMPTVAPTTAPSAAPTDMPIVAPTTAPSAVPTDMPTVAPTAAPSTAPTDTPTVSPTTAPSAVPTDMPTVAPTTAPSTAPTDMPTVAPTVVPTAAPTDMPTVAPTTAPSTAPTDMPTLAPTTAPSAAPTDMPTVAPTTAPSAAPTDMPTLAPTAAPSTAPTDTPTVSPTTAPSTAPTDMPTLAPTTAPSATPTDMPTLAPTTAPSTAPTDMPTLAPTTVPSTAPTVKPSVQPSSGPTEQPSSHPTSMPTEPLSKGSINSLAIGLGLGVPSALIGLGVWLYKKFHPVKVDIKLSSRVEPDLELGEGNHEGQDREITHRDSKSSTTSTALNDKSITNFFSLVAGENSANKVIPFPLRTTIDQELDVFAQQQMEEIIKQREEQLVDEGLAKAIQQILDAEMETIIAESIDDEMTRRSLERMEEGNAQQNLDDIDDEEIPALEPNDEYDQNSEDNLSVVLSDNFNDSDLFSLLNLDDIDDEEIVEEINDIEEKLAHNNQVNNEVFEEKVEEGDDEQVDDGYAIDNFHQNSGRICVGIRSLNQLGDYEADNFHQLGWSFIGLLNEELDF